MKTIKIKSTHPATQGPFVVINLADFDPAVHEPVDPADLPEVALEQPRALTTADLEDARAEMDRRQAELVAERERLDAQAAEQEAERVRLAEAAGKLTAAEHATESDMTAAQLKEALTARGIEFKSNASKGDLKALLDAAPAQ